MTSAETLFAFPLTATATRPDVLLVRGERGGSESREAVMAKTIYLLSPWVYTSSHPWVAITVKVGRRKALRFAIGIGASHARLDKRGN
jgi:hypothetical protein